MDGKQLQKKRRPTNHHVSKNVRFVFCHQLNFQSTKRKQYFDESHKTLRIQGLFHHSEIH